MMAGLKALPTPAPKARPRGTEFSARRRRSNVTSDVEGGVSPPGEFRRHCVALRPYHRAGWDRTPGSISGETAARRPPPDTRSAFHNVLSFKCFTPRVRRLFLCDFR